MNWIIANKILALSSPTERRQDGLPAEFFVDKFDDMNVRAIIRLNEPLYKEQVFRREGISVYDLEFLDGSCPSEVSEELVYLLTMIGRNYYLYQNL